jgi:outer membrane receptor protein involved in Fe transport
MRFNNEIVSIGQLNSMGISLGTNAKSSSRVGLEGDLTFTKNKLETGFTFNVSRNRILLDDKTSNPVLTPNFNSNLFISYKINKFEIGSNYKYVAQSFLDTDNDFICPEYHLIDLNFNYNLDSKFSIRFFVNNILDRNWTTGGTASPDFGRSFYYTSGVNFFMNVNYKL